MSKTKGFLFTAGIVLATAFTLSCEEKNADKPSATVAETGGNRTNIKITTNFDIPVWENKNSIVIDHDFFETQKGIQIPREESEYKNFAIAKLGQHDYGVAPSQDWITFSIVAEVPLHNNIYSLIIRGDTENWLKVWLVNFDKTKLDGNFYRFIDFCVIGEDEWVESASSMTSVIHLQPELYIETEKRSTDYWDSGPPKTTVTIQKIDIPKSGKFKITKATETEETEAATPVPKTAEPAVPDNRETFTDSRDEAVYKKVKIGKQTWMAENLNYAAEGSKCYKDKEDNCKKHGRLYSWETAKTACPAGWHLPSTDEWEALTEYASAGGDESGEALKAASGWSVNDRGNDGSGKDKHGFSALPGGEYSGEIGFHGTGEVGTWWSATEKGGGYVIYWGMICRNLDAYRDETDDMAKLFSVRCVKD